ncbi:MAG: hypothetical protein ACFFD1_15805 [Candidatus Thorarchaeota archaeon]
MSVENSKDKEVISRLSSYINAIFNWKEKNLTFLPCIGGYLIFESSTGTVIWINKLTIEATFRVIYDLAKDFVEDLLFSLVIGGQLIHEVVKSKFPDPPKQTVVFLPHLHAIEYGNVIISDPNGKIGATMDIIGKTVNTLGSFLTDQGKKFSKIISKNETNNDLNKNENIPKEKEEEGKTIVYIQIYDQLYIHLSKSHKFKDLVPATSGGYEFRTFFVENAALFLKQVKEKGRYVIKYKGEKKILF